MKAAVLGVGRMGTAICYAMRRLGFYVVGVDSNEHACNNFRKHIGGPDGVFYLTDDTKSWDRALEFEQPDVVISSLPYHQTKELAKWCIDRGLRYCDLGGRVDVSKEINDYSREVNKSPVMTDLGLAPGWVNILAERGCSEVHGTPSVVKMRVGGLPYLRILSKDNPLRYELTWSMDGLINEYKDDCEILQWGKVITKPGMDGYELIDTAYGEFEAFYTSGGASHTIQSMQRRGVKNCDYKTLRYPGHIDIVRFLLNKCNYSDDQMSEMFEKGCGTAEKDIVIILAEVHKEDIVWKKELKITSDFQFSAMQRATAFSISAVARMMAEGIFDNRVVQNRGGDIKLPLQLTYRDIPFDKFKKYMKELKLDT